MLSPAEIRTNLHKHLPDARPYFEEEARREQDHKRWLLIKIAQCALGAVVLVALLLFPQYKI